MTQYNIHEAKTHFSHLINRAVSGEEVIIAKAGKPIARLIPYQTDTPTRVPGIEKGKIVIKPDFDSPLPEFDL
ncbi:MAG: type II toxin-antitoxin system Phd/YefM family antitoxin [Anaerolineales bacterium]|nr:type II toxin-antitoxin system Phd/YefM family antitoxin [Anaerolineales bacterium]